MQDSSGSIRDKERAIRQAILVSLIYLVPAAQALLPIDDPDIWWRLRVGEWIAAHRSVPFVDSFSAYDAGRSWIDYSWLFELAVYLAHRWLGLVGIVLLIVSLALCIAHAARQLIRRYSFPLPAEVLLVGLALAALKPLMTPRPWLISILFFAIELGIIYQARATKKARCLWLLPLLFWVWANFHIQFVYGLAAVGLLAGEALLIAIANRRGWTLEKPDLSPPSLIVLVFACTAATLLTPYHYLIYKQVFDYMFVQTAAFDYIAELHPMFFRAPQDWIVLLLALAAAFALGWGRGWRPFPLLLLLMAALLAFRARRDAWVLALVALATIGEAFGSYRSTEAYRFTKTQAALAICIGAVVLYTLALSRGISEAGLEKIVEEKYPVRAAAFVRDKKLSGPVFNHYDWGGFLLWSLPSIGVVTDGRTNLYEDSQIERSLSTWDGAPGWQADPDLRRANLIIADKGRALTTLLRADPRYKIAYEDATAVVFVPTDSTP
ncbi:MAG: hypothetical protein ACM3SP_25980 [Chloroflexota bacterium]